MRDLLNHLNDTGIESRPFWMPMNRLKMFNKYLYISETDESSILYENCISIPSSSGIELDDVKYVTKTIKNFYK